MSNDKNHSKQFERYLKGQMSPEEAHAFERDVLDDPYAQEALEGFESQGSDSLADLEQIRKRITAQKKQSFLFLRIAAVISLLIVGSFTVYFFTTQIESDQLAIEKEPMEEIVTSTPAPDTTFIQEQKEKSENLRAESDQVKEFKQDGLRVEDKDDDVAQMVMEGEEMESAATVVSEEVYAEMEEAKATEVTKLVAIDKDSFDDELQEQVAGAPLEKVKVASYIDSSSLKDVVITAQPLVAQETNDTSKKINSLERSGRSNSVPPSATLRSLTTRESITGKVTDDYGEPLPGVNVVIKGTTTGVTTDLEGNFQLPKIDGQTLIFSFVGFETQEVEVGSQNSLDVTLGGATELQEVVVTGYAVEDGEAGLSYSPAQPTIGNRIFKKYLEENLRYPEAAKDNKIEGTVVLEIKVSSRGGVTDISIKKSLGYGCDQEAIRLVKEGPAWKAAEKDGNPIKDKVKVKVKFKL